MAGSLESHCGEAPQHREAPHSDVPHSAGWIEDGTRGKSDRLPHPGLRKHGWTFKKQAKWLPMRCSSQLCWSAYLQFLRASPRFSTSDHEKTSSRGSRSSSTLPTPGQSLALTWLQLPSTQAGTTAGGRSRASSAKRRGTWRGTAGQRKAACAPSSATQRAILQGIARARSGSPMAPAGVQKSKASSASGALTGLQRREDSSCWGTLDATGWCWRTGLSSRT